MFHRGGRHHRGVFSRRRRSPSWPRPPPRRAVSESRPRPRLYTTCHHPLRYPASDFMQGERSQIDPEASPSADSSFLFQLFGRERGKEGPHKVWNFGPRSLEGGGGGRRKSRLRRFKQVAKESEGGIETLVSFRRRRLVRSLSFSPKKSS